MLHSSLSCGLVAHFLNSLWGRADELEVVLCTDAGKGSIFCQETIARMDGLGIGQLGSSDEVGNIEVRLSAGGRPNAHRFVSKTHMQAVAVCCGVDRHGLEGHLSAGPDDAQGNFTSVGYEHFFKHSSWLLLMGWGARAALCWGNVEQRLVILHGSAVLNQYFNKCACLVRFDFVKELHRFNDA